MEHLNIKFKKTFSVVGALVSIGFVLTVQEVWFGLRILILNLYGQ